MFLFSKIIRYTLCKFSCYTIFLLFIAGCNSLLSEHSDKKALVNCLDKGIEISDLIASSNTEKLKKVFVDGYQMKYLFEVLDDEIMKYEKYELNQPNIFYNPFKNQYIYTIYASKWIDNGTDWGLGDYLFVFQIAFVFDDATQKVSVENYRILKDHVGFKTWWFSFMRSYSENSCRRNLWADSYGIIPPPPPPPVTEDWLQSS